jgi:hypothetical protein
MWVIITHDVYGGSELYWLADRVLAVPWSHIL